MAASFQINIDVSGLAQLAPALEHGMFTKLAAAVAATADVGRERWQRAVLSAPLWEGERRAYADSITARQVGPYEWEIASDYKYVEDIEDGRPPFDLKQMLGTSPKVRRTKDGRRFLVIPLRQNTPGNSAHAPAMPSHVYGMAKALKLTKIAGEGERRSGEITALSPKFGMHPLGARQQRQNPFLSDPGTRKAYMVAKRDYDWGGRLTRRMLKEGGASKDEQRRYAGMHRFKEATGGSSYITFRVMIEGQTGWIIPAKPGLFIAKHVAESLQRTAALDFPAAMQADLGS